MSKNNKNKIIKIIFIRHGESTENISVSNGEAYDKDNIILTEKGIKQSKITGKYLNKTYKKFDYIISSPITRCIQTSNIIMNELKYNHKELIIDKNLIENGSNYDSLAGLSKIDRDEIIDSDKKYNKILTKINLTKNPYKKYILNKKIYNYVINNYKYSPNLYEVKDNIINFLSKLKILIKENNYKKILVITHGGVINIVQKIICNIDIETEIYLSNKEFTHENELLGNCTCSCIGLENNEFKLISPANTYHLV